MILRKKFVRLRLQSWDRGEGLKGAKWKYICWTITLAHKNSNLFINSRKKSLFWVWFNLEAKSFFSPLTLFSLHRLTDRHTDRLCGLSEETFFIHYLWKRQTDGQTDKRTDRQMDRRTDRHIDRLRGLVKSARFLLLRPTSANCSQLAEVTDR